MLDSAAITHTAMPEQATQEGVWSPRYRLLTIGVILTVAGSAFEALAVATTLPTMVRELRGLDLYGWAFSAFLLTNLLGSTLAGGEADRQGLARPFVAGVSLFSLGLLIAGLAPTMPVVIVGRAVQGLGAGAIGSTAFVAVGRGYPEAARPRMLALLSSAWVIPGLIGPALAGLIADYAGWRWVFLALVPLTPLAAALALPELSKIQGTATAAPRDWKRVQAALLLVLGVALLMAGLGRPAPLQAIPLVLIGILLGLPALRRLLPAGTLRAAPGLPAAIATLGLLNLSFFGADAYVPLALTSIRGQSSSIAGLALTAATVAWTTGAWIQAHLVRHGRRRLLVLLGLALIAAAIVGTIVGLSPDIPPATMIAAWGLAGLGMGLSFSTISLVVLEQAPAGEEGVASAAMQIVGGLGTALGTGLGGVVVALTSQGETASRHGIVLQDLFMIAAVILAASAGLRLSDKEVPPTPTQPQE